MPDRICDKQPFINIFTNNVTRARNRLKSKKTSGDCLENKYTLGHWKAFNYKKIISAVHNFS